MLNSTESDRMIQQEKIYPILVLNQSDNFEYDQILLTELKPLPSVDPTSRKQMQILKRKFHQF